MLGLKDDLLSNDVMLWNSTSYNRTKLDGVIFEWHEKNVLTPLLRAGCRYTLTDKLLSTPLHVASYYGNTVAIRSLVKQYQDDGETAKLAKHLNKENAYGRTVFENAAIGGYSSAQLFLKFLQPSAENDRGTRARKKVVHYDVNADNSSLASL